jgi:starch synthase
MDRMMDLPINLALMGLGEARYQDFFAGAAENWPGRLGYKKANDSTLLRHILSGSDIFIMPSRFEPCGMEQLYALSYGTVPVVRGTGGLDDTVVDLMVNPEEGTGYKFEEYSAEAFLETLDRAVRDFSDQDRWLSAVRRGMAGNFSWDNSAALYESVYRNALEVAGKRV